MVVEFFDDESPSCGRFHPNVEDLRDRYEGRVTFAVRHFPLPSHPSAVPAARAAEAAAQQGAFQPSHALLLERQEQWSVTVGAAAAFRGNAEELGLDLRDFGEVETAIEAALAG